MRSEIAVSLEALEGELKRLDALTMPFAEDSGTEGTALLRRARGRLIDAIDALKRAEQLIATDRTAPQPIAPPTLDDRIALIELAAGNETFRTKIKLKPAELQAVPALAPLADDLTRIRGIDATTAARLAELGVASFAAIAAWNQGDVRNVSGALSIGRQISQQNWIEQAALLRGPIAKTKLPQHAPEHALAVVEVMVPVLAQAPAPISKPAPDRLELIQGIDMATAGALNAAGVMRWAEIASWQRSDLGRLAGHLPAAAIINKAGWIEQAALLSSGRRTAFAQRFERGEFNAHVLAPTVELLPEPVFAAWEFPEPDVPVVADEAPVLEALQEPAPVAQSLPAEISTEPAPFEPAQPSAEPVAAVAPEMAEAPIHDHLSALEQELATVVANDKAASNGNTEQEPAGEPGPLVRDSRLNIEDEEFLELSVGEADVLIVRPLAIATPAPNARPVADPAARNLMQRLKRVPALDDIDSATYAGYKDQVEEATVEIIPADGRKIAPRLGYEGDDDDDTTSNRPISRLLRSFRQRS